MKKIYVLLSAMTISFGSYAQLSLTKAANEPVTGDFALTKGFDSTGVVPKNTGAGLNWNFSAFSQNTVNAGSTYTTPGSVAQSSLYAGCTVVEQATSGDKTFWKATATQFEMQGIYNSVAGIEFNMTSNPVVTAVWPINFGYNMTDAGSGTVSALSNNGTINQTLTVVGSGTGTVVIPGNVTYTNILQTKSTTTLIAVIPSLQYTINVVGTTYAYYSGTQKFPLVTVNYEKSTLTSPFGPTVSTTADISMNSLVITTGINEVNFDADFTMYPNPAKDNISVNLSNTNNNKGSVEIYNELGQVARRVELGNDATIKTTISVADLKPGVYFVKTNLGERTTTKKLIIQ
jgi:hypothetical protein